MKKQLSCIKLDVSPNTTLNKPVNVSRKLNRECNDGLLLILGLN